MACNIVGAPIGDSPTWMAGDVWVPDGANWATAAVSQPVPEAFGAIPAARRSAVATALNRTCKTKPWKQHPKKFKSKRRDFGL